MHSCGPQKPTFSSIEHFQDREILVCVAFTPTYLFGHHVKNTETPLHDGVEELVRRSELMRTEPTSRSVRCDSHVASLAERYTNPTGSVLLGTMPAVENSAAAGLPRSGVVLAVL